MAVDSRVSCVLLLLFMTIYCNNARVLWSLTSFPSSDILKDFHADHSFGDDNMAIANDPAGGHGKVLRIFYPKGSYKPSHHPQGGAQFFSEPTGQRTSMTLTYDIYFPKNFDFVKGGKLPGLMGGTTRTCSGGRDSDHCFTTRFMFRSDGDGEVYLYAPHDQESSFCDRHDVICNFDFGHSLGRGSWKWKTGEWQTISQHVHLNTLGKHDGYIKVWLNGKQVYESRNLLFRREHSVEITGMYFSTFFGGGSSSWATPHDTYTYYRNFYLTDDAHPHVIG
ncbi:uncharacterized protein LOC135469104 [Liolophura sinensis]|uniref:uncharacterized protein LOC135469104 n=1 Tax=Liolophura sinensis TaxID=3198878 RepID=UPI003157FDCC